MVSKFWKSNPDEEKKHQFAEIIEKINRKKNKHRETIDEFVNMVKLFDLLSKGENISKNDEKRYFFDPLNTISSNLKLN